MTSLKNNLALLFGIQIMKKYYVFHFETTHDCFIAFCVGLYAVSIYLSAPNIIGALRDPGL